MTEMLGLVLFTGNSYRKDDKLYVLEAKKNYFFSTDITLLNKGFGLPTPYKSLDKISIFP